MPPSSSRIAGRLVRVVGALGGLVLLAGCEQPAELKFGGYVEAEKIEVGSRVGGRVQQVFVEEGDEVAAGKVLVRFETAHLVAQLEEARQHASKLETAWNKLVAGPRPQEIKIARQEHAGAKARAENATSQYRRAKETGSGAVTAERLDELEAMMKVARSEELAREQELQMLEEGTRAEDKIIAQRDLDEARARLLVLEDQLNEGEVRAPLDSVVEVCDLQPGDLVAGGTPLATLIRRDELWVRCFVPTTQITFMRVGQRVDVTVDSRPHDILEGRVQRINRVAEYTPRNVQTFDQRQDQVFGVKIRVRDPQGVLRPGMASTVRLRDAPSKTPSTPVASPEGRPERSSSKQQAKQP